MRRMKKIAFLFPGQEPVMQNAGLELADRSTAARSLLERVADKTGVDVLRLLSRGGPTLERSEIMQPTLVAVSLGALHELAAAGVVPDIVAGLSLGELSALCAAGCISPRDAVDVAVLRGRVMGEVAKRHPGRLLALRVQNETDVDEALRVGQGRGVVAVASRNAPDQIVISGDEAALRLVARQLPSTWLAMQGPWHSPLMEEAVDPLHKNLDAIPFSAARAEFVCNRTGEIVRRDEDLPRMLAEQLMRPVLWTESLQTLARVEVTDYVTVGPGKVMRSLLRKNIGFDLRLHRTDDCIDIDETIEAIAPVHGEDKGDA